MHEEQVYDVFEKFQETYTLELFSETFCTIFRSMAVKGFYTYVRTNLEDSLSTDYALVAYPRDEVPESMNDTIRNPFNKNFGDEFLHEYISKISIDAPNVPIDNLDIMFR